MDLLYQWLSTHFKTTFLLFLFANSLSVLSHKYTDVEIRNVGEKTEVVHYFVMVILCALCYFIIRKSNNYVNSTVSQFIYFLCCGDTLPFLYEFRKLKFFSWDMTINDTGNFHGLMKEILHPRSCPDLGRKVLLKSQLSSVHQLYTTGYILQI